MNKVIAHISILLTSIMLSVFMFAEAESVNSASNESSTDADNKQAIIIDYIVQEGDTLSSLTQQYLGDSLLWKLNEQINPELPNVNYLKPGTSIRLITGYSEPEPEVVASQATIVLKSNQVNKSLQGGDWSDAVQGEDIFSGDGLRTLRESSALLEFGDKETETEKDQVQVYENSVIFLREEKLENSKATRNEIEIEKGGAQIELSKKEFGDDEVSNEYEINVGGVITIPTLGIDGKSLTKARIGDADASQVMVYNGSSTVESAGVSVAVETGMGTVAVAGEAPAEPERLLLAPAINADNPSSSELDKNISVEWTEMTGASHYRLDLCSDKACKSIERTVDKLKQTVHTLAGLKVGDWFWRITAVSASGLDGFPSAVQSLNIFKPKPAPIPEPEEEINIPYIVGLTLAVYLLLLLIIQLLSGQRVDHESLLKRHFSKK